MSPRLSPWWRAVHLSGLFALAVAQPVFDLLGRGAEYFVAHGSTPADVVLFALLPCTAVPIAFYLAARLADLAGETAGRWLHLALFAALGTAFALLSLRHLPIGNASVPLAGVAGVAAAALYARFEAVGSLLSVLGLAPLAVSALFLWQPGIRRLAAPRAAAVVADVEIANPVPVVLVVFDELSGLTLMNENQEIDAARYPNFGKLAEQATWFRNATGVSFHSTIALPSILTGRYPAREALPAHEDFPQNLFTLLGGTYRVTAFETLTRLCPREVCRQIASAPWRDRLRGLLLDASVAYAHLLLPESLGRAWLPSIRDRWGGFVGDEPLGPTEQVDEMMHHGWRRRRGAPPPKVPGVQAVLSMDRAELFDRYLGAIEPSEEPALYFLHIALPHTPLQFLPSGKKYSRVSGDEGANPGGVWTSDEWTVLQSTQRHLIQLGYVDRLVGQLIARLEEVGLYDRALVIVTADHGLASVPGEPRRTLGDTGYPELVLVPLFVKLPGQTGSAVSDRNVESIDIVPTIAHALSMRLPWPVDGVSVFDEGAARQRKQFLVRYAKGGPEWRVLDPALPEKELNLRRLLDRFGSGTTRPNGVFAIGPYRDLVGQAVPSEVPVYPGLSLQVGGKGYARVDLDAFVPARVSGSVGGAGEPPIHIAVAVNGTIAAVTQVTSAKRGFTAMIPESSLRQGENDVQAYLIRDESGAPKLYAAAK